MECPLCRRLWAKLNDTERGIVDRSELQPYKDKGGLFRYSITPALKNGEHEVALWCRFEQGGVDYNKFGTLDLVPTGAAVSRFAPHWKTSSTGSTATLQLAKQWLSECMENHSTCSKGAEHECLPTRLLRINEDLTSFSLVATSDVEAGVPYAALSYCWGGECFLKLTMSNERTLRDGRPMSDLPKAFQEAMRVCITLGVSYLWIDALCIIQEEDELQDWIKESAHMGQVYANATCVVAATASQKPSEGLFRHQRDGDFAATRLVLPPAVLGPLSPGTYDAVPGRFWQDHVDLTALNHRAWVLQERTLGRRILHFGSKELLWECREFNRCQSFPDGLPTSVPTASVKLGAPRPAVIIEDENESPWYDVWYHLVARYTSTYLSFPDDRMVAVSGIAKEFERLLQDKYVAGLWESRLQRDLMWTTTLNIDRPAYTGRHDRFRAPSFSWLSLEWPCSLKPSYHDWKILEYYYTVVSITLGHQTSDTTGLVRSGELVLDGILMPVTLTERPGHMDLWHVSSSGIAAIDLSVDHTRDNLPVRTKNDEHLCMPAARTATKKGRGDTSTRCFLLEVVNAENGTYRRLGMAFFSPDQYAQLQSSRPAGSAYPCIEYDTSASRHRIRIV